MRGLIAQSRHYELALAARDKKIAQPVPGLRPEKQLHFLYVETLADETSLSHLRWCSRAYRAAIKANAVARPKSGLLGTTSWLLLTPDGRRFLGLQVNGDWENWTFALKHCAKNGGRATGELIGYVRIPARFVVDDGTTCQSDQCICKKG